MNTLKMSHYGPILTGRPFGKQVMQELTQTLKYPIVLDFSDVLSLGSSFGDEVVAVIARNQNGKIAVVNPNKAVWSCLSNIAQDHKIRIDVL